MVSTGDVLCLFSGQVEEQNDKFVVEIPKNEVEMGAVSVGDLYRFGVFDATDLDDAGSAITDKDAVDGVQGTTTESVSKSRRRQPARTKHSGGEGPPLEEGEERIVKIEDMGEQGDGLARVERGYIVFVEGTEIDEEVRVRVKKTKKNVAFAEVIEREPGSPNRKDSPLNS